MGKEPRVPQNSNRMIVLTASVFVSVFALFGQGNKLPLPIRLRRIFPILIYTQSQHVIIATKCRMRVGERMGCLFGNIPILRPISAKQVGLLRLKRLIILARRHIRAAQKCVNMLRLCLAFRGD